MSVVRPLARIISAISRIVATQCDPPVFATYQPSRMSSFYDMVGFYELKFLIDFIISSLLLLASRAFN